MALSRWPLATEMLHKPETVELAISQPIDTISHAIYPVEQLRKTEMLLNLLQDGDDGQVLVFTRTKHGANRLATTHVDPLMRIVRTFGFHLAVIDVRQNSAFHDRALAQLHAPAAKPSLTTGLTGPFQQVPVTQLVQYRRMLPNLNQVIFEQIAQRDR